MNNPTTPFLLGFALSSTEAPRKRILLFIGLCLPLFVADTLMPKWPPDLTEFDFEKFPENPVEGVIVAVILAVYILAVVPLIKWLYGAAWLVKLAYTGMTRLIVLADTCMTEGRLDVHLVNEGCLEVNEGCL